VTKTSETRRPAGRDPRANLQEHALFHAHMRMQAWRLLVGMAHVTIVGETQLGNLTAQCTSTSTRAGAAPLLTPPLQKGVFDYKVPLSADVAIASVAFSFRAA
jgi:hypothetical protein